MREVGRSVPRKDAYDKVSGRAKYTADLIPPHTLCAKVLHSDIAHGEVLAIDCQEAAALDGVVKIITCFDVPEIDFATAGHPWSVEPSHRDIADRRLLNRRVRYHGDDIAVVIAEDEIIAQQALKLIKVEYDEYEPYIGWQAAAAAGARAIHDAAAGNLLKQHRFEQGDWQAVEADGSLLTLDKNYHTQMVQHCHIETALCYAYGEGGKIVVVSATQIPHIARRIIGQALGVPWGSVRVIKPYIGGGFGNRQDLLYEPLCAYCAQQIGGRAVKLVLSREEVFRCTRNRHAIDFHIKGWADAEGNLQARLIEAHSQQGAYASHGHAIVANAVTAMRCIYDDRRALKQSAATYYTNTAASGAMRGYGIPQAAFAMESFIDDMAVLLGIDPLELRLRNMMPRDYVDAGTGIAVHSYGLEDCLRRGAEQIDWQRKRALYAQPQSGNLRRGIGMGIFCYKTGVYPISLETSSARMVLNQDGTAQLHLGATEIGQGADTVFAQMAAEASGLATEDIYVATVQDTDVAPFDTGAYASRQTYVTGKAIKDCAALFKRHILDYAATLPQSGAVAAIIDGAVADAEGRRLITLAELAEIAFYSLDDSRHISAEVSHHCDENTYAFGACFAEIEVDIAYGRIKVLRLLNVHDSGRLINPQLAAAQVHGGMSMGLGYAMSEELLYDERGRLLNGNLLDYKLPTAMDTPDLEVMFVGGDDPSGPFGNKALGEPPAIPVAPALRNALLQATGIGFDELPLTPKKLVAKFAELGLI
ncbi:MAG: xanthine dehydrogenase molybdenum-binding subunit XdhA [Bacillota bacterium]|nr:xanthine dehydrogenase molybdenum-binding subunit XdhA [Bacillota bacterium]